MKATTKSLSFLILSFVGCAPSEDVRAAQNEAMTQATLAILITAIEDYEKEYQKPISFDSSKELAAILEGQNEKGILFYSFPEDSRNELGEILDGYGNPIRIINQNGQITLYSNGRNGVMDSAPTTDDIIMQHEIQKHNQTG